VAGAHLGLGGEALDGLVVELARGLGRDGLLGFLVEIGVEQRLVARIRDLAGEIRALADPRGLGRAGAELEVDEVADEEVAALRLRHLGELERRVLGRDRDVGLGDLDAVDLGEHLRGRGGGTLREGEAGRQRRHGDAEGEQAGAERQDGVHAGSSGILAVVTGDRLVASNAAPAGQGGPFRAIDGGCRLALQAMRAHVTPVPGPRPRPGHGTVIHPRPRTARPAPGCRAVVAQPFRCAGG
jgi:hypothetical protein